MKDKILEMLKGKLYFHSDDSGNGEEAISFEDLPTLSEDITAMVLEFVEWAMTEAYIKALTGKIGIVSTDIIVNYWKDLFNYWHDNIYKK